MNSLQRYHHSAGWLRNLIPVAAVLLLGLQTTSAQLVTARFTTSASTWEQFDTIGVSHKVFRGFQSVLLDIGQADFSIHTNMQAATSIGDNIPEDSDYRL